MSLIFLSHGNQDNEIAGALAHWLAAEGHTAVFLDYDARVGIAGGEPWEERLYTELRRCRALIALISPDWLTSPWCVAEANHAQALRRPVLPVHVRPIDQAEYQSKAPPVLRQVQRIDWSEGEEARIRLRRGLIAAGLDPKELFIWHGDRAPYPGLAALERQDAAVFFGREQEITDLLAVLRECRAPGRARLVVLQGASGSGKSSLLRAGVAPRLERDPASWILVPPFRPLRNPFQGLADALRGVATDLPEDPIPSGDLPAAENQADRIAWIATWVRWISNVAASLRHRSRHTDATVLILVDQLEEALVGPDGGSGNAFLLALREMLVAADHRLLVLATLRADFIGALQRHPALREPAAAGGEILATRAVQLGPLPRAAFHAVIEGPAALASLELEAGLTSRLMDEARTDDALPLLAFVLRELWDRCGRRDLKLTHAEYDGFGGLEAAVGLRAENIVAAVEPSAAELDAFRATLVFGMAELSAEGRVLRRRLPVVRVTASAKRLVEEFARARLLVADEAAVEVAHEALFRRWKLLADWIKDAREDLSIQRRAREASEAWNAAGRPRGSLWRSPDLDLLQRYAGRSGGSLPVLEAEFLRLSQLQSARLKTLARTAVVAIVILFIGAIGFAIESRNQTELAQENFARAERNFDAARQAALGLVTDLANGLRDRVGMPLVLVRQILGRAEEVIRKLQQNVPDDPRLLSLQSSALIEFSETFRSIGDAVQAREAAARAVAVAMKAAARDPGNADRQRILGATEYQLGRALDAEGSVKDAIEAQERSLEILQRVVIQDPDNAAALRDLARSLAALGDLWKSQGQAKRALDLYRKGLNATERLDKLQPKNDEWQREQSIVHGRIGLALMDLGQLEEALIEQHLGHAIIKRLADGDQGQARWQQDLAHSHNRISLVLRQQSKFEEALAQQREALAVNQRLAEQEPTNAEWRTSLSMRHAQIGETLERKGDNTGAVTEYRKATAVLRELADRDPANMVWQRDLAVDHLRVGDVLDQGGNRKDALAAWQSALVIFQSLISIDPANTLWQRDLLACLQRVSEGQMQSGNLLGALEAYRSRLTSATALVAHDPDDPAAQRDLGISHVQLAKALLKAGDTRDAASHAHAALCLLGQQPAGEALVEHQDLEELRDLARSLGGDGGGKDSMCPDRKPKH